MVKPRKRLGSSRARRFVSRSRHHDIYKLAAEQGVKPLKEFDALLRYSSPDPEGVAEFLEMLRVWRRDVGPGKLLS